MAIKTDIIEDFDKNNFCQKVSEFYKKYKYGMIKTEYSHAIDSSGQNKHVDSYQTAGKTSFSLLCVYEDNNPKDQK